NSLHPGAVNTPMGTGDMMGALTRASEANPNLMNMVTPFLPDFIAEPEDISDAVVWLAGDESKMVTAARIPVDLGSTIF
ncbi:MAG: SDR family oxidoreductase, partial [Mycobacterium sp.]